MEPNDTIKADLKELVKAYTIVSSIVSELRDEGVINPHDCDNVLGHLKSGMIEDILMYTRANFAQQIEKNALKTMRDYQTVKRTLERQNINPDEIKEILGLFFKK